jgi:NAD(P)-dependent dehydrogenase (short-subunit alcohol dehydrogenase family)
MQERTPSVVITGASTGIGEACALHLDRLGWRVFAGVRQQQDADRLRASASARLTPVVIDVTDGKLIAQAAAEIGETLADGGLAGLVNNAGIAVAGPLEFVPIDELRRQLEVNVVGQVAVTQAFLEQIRRAAGRVVHIGSIGGRLATPFVGPYSASKHAMEAITDAMRFELAPWGIGVSIVEPGSIATPIWDKGQVAADEMLKRLPERATELYGDDFTAVRSFAIETGKRGIPPAAVAKAVAHALTSKRPRTRYIVGRDARLQALAATFAPDRFIDRVIAGRLGVSRARRA